MCSWREGGERVGEDMLQIEEERVVTCLSFRTFNVGTTASELSMSSCTQREGKVVCGSIEKRVWGWGEDGGGGGQGDVEAALSSTTLSVGTTASKLLVSR